MFYMKTNCCLSDFVWPPKILRKSVSNLNHYSCFAPALESWIEVGFSKTRICVQIISNHSFLIQPFEEREKTPLENIFTLCRTCRNVNERCPACAVHRLLCFNSPFTVQWSPIRASCLPPLRLFMSFGLRAITGSNPHPPT